MGVGCNKVQPRRQTKVGKFLRSCWYEIWIRDPNRCKGLGLFYGRITSPACAHATPRVLRGGSFVDSVDNKFNHEVCLGAYYCLEFLTLGALVPELSPWCSLSRANAWPCLASMSYFYVVWFQYYFFTLWYISVSVNLGYFVDPGNNAHMCDHRPT